MSGRGGREVDAEIRVCNNVKQENVRGCDHPIM